VALLKFFGLDVSNIEPRRKEAVSRANETVLGRRICKSPCHEGPRWRHVLDFHPSKRTPNGEPLYFSSICKTCCTEERRRKNGAKRRRRIYRASMTLEQRRAYQREKDRIERGRIRNDPKRAELARERWRFQKEGERRRKGIPPRPIGPLSKKYALNRQRGGRSSPILDAGPLLEVFDELEKRRKAAQYGAAFGGMDTASLHDVLGETLTRALRRARQTGRITEVVASDILDLLPTNNSVHTLWPDA
jgi:hypothetical protein